eukprot:5232160-Pleurochrysis_carterae.AAC.1
MVQAGHAAYLRRSCCFAKPALSGSVAGGCDRPFSARANSSCASGYFSKESSPQPTSLRGTALASAAFELGSFVVGVPAVEDAA